MGNLLFDLPRRFYYWPRSADSQLFYALANIPTTAAVIITAVAHPK